jgi:hypothetical protein
MPCSSLDAVHGEFALKLSFCLPFPFACVSPFQGVSFLVYGNKINIYSGMDPMQKEFMEAGRDYIQAIVRALPIYMLYPNKQYRDYERIVRRMQRAGKSFISVMVTVSPKLTHAHQV